MTINTEFVQNKDHVSFQMSMKYIINWKIYCCPILNMMYVHGGSFLRLLNNGFVEFLDNVGK